MALSISHSKEDYNPLLHRGRKSENGLVNLIKRIWNVVSGIFNNLGEFLKRVLNLGSSKLTIRDQEMIQNARSFAHPAPPSPIAQIRVTQVDLSQEAKDPKGKEELDAVVPQQHYAEIDNPVMKEFHATSQELVSKIVMAVYEEKIEGAVTSVKAGMVSLSEGLKTAANLVIQIGNKSAKPFFEMIRSATIEEKFKPDYIRLISWLRTNETKAALTKKIHGLFEKENVENLESFIGPCIEWLFETNQSDTFATIYKKHDIDILANKAIIDKVLERALTLLLDNKIDDFVQVCQNDLGKRLPEIIHKSLKENVTRISDILVRRFIAISENAPYTNTFDALIELIADQASAISVVEQKKEVALQEGKKLIAKAKSSPANLQAAQDFLNDVNTIGEEKWLAQWVENESIKTFTNFEVLGEDGVYRKFCHPNIVKVMTDPKMKQEEKDKIEEQMFDNIANELISVLFPKQKVEYPDGTVEEVDGLIFLTGQIQIPDEFKVITNYGINITNEIITPATKEMIENIYRVAGEHAGDRIKEIVIIELKKLIHTGMVRAAKILFSQFITPELINELMAKEIFPIIQKEILVSASKLIIKKNPAAYCPNFFEIIDASDEVKRKEKVEKLCQKLHDELQKIFILNKEQFDSFSEKDFFEIMENELFFIESGIRNYQRGKNLPNTLQSVKTAVVGYFADMPHDNNHKFGDIIVNLVFGIGNFKGFWVNLVSRLFKGKISDIMSEATAKFRKSPDHMIHLATLQMKKKIDDKALRVKMFGEKKVLTQQETKQLLEKEIEKTAKAVKDLITHVSGAASNAVGTEGDLNQLITNVYKKVLGDKHKVHNLLLKAQEVAVAAMKDASGKIVGFMGESPIKMAKPPSVIPYLFDV